jgi:hypothetical protein
MKIESPCENCPTLVCIYDEESNKELGIFTFLLKIQNELKKVGNFHQTLESTKLVKTGKMSFLLQIQKYMTKFWKLLLANSRKFDPKLV